jgi:hypothetical protein
MAYNYTIKALRPGAKHTKVEKIPRIFNEHDQVYCDMQGQIFRAGINMGVRTEVFADAFMHSRITAVMDYDCTRTSARQENVFDSLILMEEPQAVADLVMMMIRIPARKAGSKTIQEMMKEDGTLMLEARFEPESDKRDDPVYAYWLGYIYRYECFLRNECSLDIYNRYSEQLLHNFYMQATEVGEIHLPEDAAEICSRIERLRNTQEYSPRK